MFTPDLLKMYFAEFEDLLGFGFDEWVLDSGYQATWTDQQIYNALPQEIQAELGDIVMNASWYHGGM